MADLLGNQVCMESLQSDIQDVQWIINDVMSRTGPVGTSSWKFPDKLSWELDMEELLQMYAYSTDETDENQVAHIALYELLIDRLVLLLQATAIYINQIHHLDKISTNPSVPPTSVGLAVRHFWGQLVNAQTVILQLHSQSKSYATKVSELEKTLKKLSSENAHHSTKSSPSVHYLDQDLDYCQTVSSNFKTISHDEISKASQTVETAFVPCEACDLVQRKIRESGDLVIEACQNQGLPSCLRKCRSQLADTKWMDGYDVARWMAEQSKDLQRLCKHIDYLSKVIDPLKAEVSAFQQETQKAEKEARACEKALTLEKETTVAIKKQYEKKLKDTEAKHELSLADLHRQREELLCKYTVLEEELKNHKTKSSEIQAHLKQTEGRCEELEKDLREKAVAVSQLEGVDKEAESLRQQLSETRMQLEATSKTLTKEQGKHKSAAHHSEQVKAKQEMLSERVRELDEENESLREQVGGLEEENQELEEHLREARSETRQLQKEKQEQEIIIKNLNSRKSELEYCIEKTETQIKELERQVEQAREREKMLIEYPDLNGPVNANLHGTDDIVLDMQNQIEANTMRMQVLEDQNERLKRSITKVLSAGHQRTAAVNPVPAQPVPLWKPDHLHSLKHQSETPLPPVSTQPHCMDTQQHVMLPSAQVSQITAGFSEKPSVPTRASEFFTVGRAPGETAKDNKRASRPPSGKSSTGGGSGGFIPVNSTSIGAYKQIKKYVGQSRSDAPIAKGKSVQSTHTSNRVVMSQEDTSLDYVTSPCYVCDICDKMYSKARDLDIHKMYCKG